MYTLKNRLSKQEQEELFVKLAKTLAVLHGPEESAQLLKDLLSEAEVFMLARRLQIAELLMAGHTYEQIREKMKVGQSTIAKVQTWLALYGEGYRTVIKRTGKDKSSDSPPKSINAIKRKYPMYFWPQLLLEEIINSANAREKQRLLNIIAQMKEKTQLSRQLTKLLQYD